MKFILCKKWIQKLNINKIENYLNLFYYQGVNQGKIGGDKMLKDLTNEKLIRLHIHAKNWEDAIRQAAQPLIDEHKVKQEYVDDQFVLKRQDGTEIPRVPASQPSPATYIKSTLRDGYKLFLEETRKLAAQDPTSPVYFIIDDIFTLGSTIEAISASIRDLRCFVEDHFSVAK